LPLGATPAVEGDGETAGFVANLLDQAFTNQGIAAVTLYDSENASGRHVAMASKQSSPAHRRVVISFQAR
jgi:hypothetical protein